MCGAKSGTESGEKDGQPISDQAGKGMRNSLATAEYNREGRRCPSVFMRSEEEDNIYGAALERNRSLYRFMESYSCFWNGACSQIALGRLESPGTLGIVLYPK